MKKLLFISIVFFLSFYCFSITRGFHAGGSVGAVFPDSDIRENYPGNFVFGGNVFYKLEKFNISLDYIYFRSVGETPFTKTDAVLSLHYFFLGPEFNLRVLKKDFFIGGGLSLNSLKEDVGKLGYFSKTKSGFYISAGIRFPFKKFFTGIKFIYNFLKIEGSDTGGLFLVLSAGF